MGSDQLLADAVSLMLLGMGTVFVFLTLLVFVTSLMSSAVNKLVPAPIAAPPPPDPDGAVDDATVLAVIGAAIHTHRSRR